MRLGPRVLFASQMRYTINIFLAPQGISHSEGIYRAAGISQIPAGIYIASRQSYDWLDSTLCGLRRVIYLLRKCDMRLTPCDIFALQMRYAAYAVRYICFANAIYGLRRAIYLLRKCDMRLAPRDIFASQMRYTINIFLAPQGISHSEGIYRAAGISQIPAGIYIASRQSHDWLDSTLYGLRRVIYLLRKCDMRLAPRDIFASQMRYTACAVRYICFANAIYKKHLLQT